MKTLIEFNGLFSIFRLMSAPLLSYFIITSFILKAGRCPESETPVNKSYKTAEKLLRD